ncbi:SDR family NAD(P)-dependent oxidoreductase [Bryobacter aggregatus]|uniref:SDR family NAD(P)-dependent oxidoreductase n=1 Tax=Bryobacter aggregatus TaxID=360054 RepID=UPI0004E1A965|nr:SDR family oxidoreductase [Bryobacter aggregatus]
MFSFANQTVVVTGGTSGIGAAIARAFEDAGAKVHALGLETGLDVSNAASIEAALAPLNELHVLVNAAGIIRRLDEHQPEVFAQVIDINLNGTMRMAHACHAMLKASQGSMVNIASMLSFLGSGPAPAYSASKGGVAQLTKSLAIAWAPDQIRVNALAPGWIETPLTKPLTEDDAKRDALTRRTPMGRWGKPEDVAGPALFLASPAAAFITGAILPVDGGYLIA